MIVSAALGEPAATPLRIVVCRAPRGYLGLPAGKTRCVAAVKVFGEPVANAVVDTSEGAVTFLDATHLVDAFEAAPRPFAATREAQAIWSNP